MGPRHCWRGKGGRKIRHGGNPVLLQWGHAVASVEKSSAAVQPCCRSSLQWGHATASVEKQVSDSTVAARDIIF